MEAWLSHALVGAGALLTGGGIVGVFARSLIQREGRAAVNRFLKSPDGQEFAAAIADDNVSTQEWRKWWHAVGEFLQNKESP